MKLDAAGIAFIQRAEGFRDRKYICAAGKETIGFGHVIRANEMIEEPMSVASATALLRADVIQFETAVNAIGVSLTQSQFNALVSLCYNIGTRAFSESTLVKKLKNLDYEGAGKEFLRWKYIQGKVSPGLLKRRQQELELWRSEPMTKFLSVTSITAFVGMLAVILGYCGVEISAQEQAELVTNASSAVSGIGFLIIFARNVITKLKAKK